MQEAIERLIKLNVKGQMTYGVTMDDYTEDNDALPDECLMELEDICKNIKQPVTWQEAAVLGAFFPQNALYGLEWTMIHHFESVLSYDNPNFKPGDAVPQRYLDLVRNCKSAYVKEILLTRCGISEDVIHSGAMEADKDCMACKFITQEVEKYEDGTWVEFSRCRNRNSSHFGEDMPWDFKDCESFERYKKGDPEYNSEGFPYEKDDQS